MTSPRWAASPPIYQPIARAGGCWSRTMATRNRERSRPFQSVQTADSGRQWIPGSSDSGTMAHYISTDPGNRFVFVPLKGGPSVAQLVFDPASGTNEAKRAAAGDGRAGCGPSTSGLPPERPLRVRHQRARSDDDGLCIRREDGASARAAGAFRPFPPPPTRSGPQPQRCSCIAPDVSSTAPIAATTAS